MVRSAPCSYPVVTSALRKPLSKPLSDIVYLWTIVQTHGLFEEDIETDMQTSPISLLDLMVYWAYLSSCPSYNWSESSQVQQQKLVAKICNKLTCIMLNSPEVLQLLGLAIYIAAISVTKSVWLSMAPWFGQPEGRGWMM